MMFILFGKPIVFWLGSIALISFIYQLYLGYGMTRGHTDYYRKHKINARILTVLVIIHIIFGIIIYF